MMAAITSDDRRHPLAKVYDLLKQEGLLRGSSLSDRIEIEGTIWNGRSDFVGSVRIALELMRMGPFEAVHVWEDRKTGRWIVERETADTKRQRLAWALGGGGGWAEDTNEYASAIEAAGGWDAVAGAIMAMGRKR